MRSLLTLTLLLAAQTDPTPALFTALADHNLPAMRSLLKAGASPNARDPEYHKGILNRAIELNDLDAMELLLDAGADIDAPDGMNLPPLVSAADMVSLPAVEFLLARGARVDVRDHLQHTALIQAVNRDALDMVRVLLAAGADVNALDRTRVSLLMKASLANTQDVIPLLLKAGAHYASSQEEMMAAASYGDALRIRALAASGTPVNFDGGQGQTPLMAAALKGQTVAVRALLAAGADPNALDQGHRNALYNAIRSAHRTTVDTLLAAGADPTTKDGGGQTTIMYLANFMDDPDLLRILIAAGVDPNAVTTNGSRFNALMQAATMGHTQVLKGLLAAGAQVNLQTVLEGDTALIDAARSGSKDCVTLLLAAAADPTLRDHRTQPGKTAHDWAVAFHHPDVAALLEK